MKNYDLTEAFLNNKQFLKDFTVYAGKNDSLKEALERARLIMNECEGHVSILESILMNKKISMKQNFTEEVVDRTVRQLAFSVSMFGMIAFMSSPDKIPGKYSTYKRLIITPDGLKGEYYNPFIQNIQPAPAVPVATQQQGQNRKPVQTSFLSEPPFEEYDYEDDYDYEDNYNQREYSDEEIKEALRGICAGKF